MPHLNRSTRLWPVWVLAGCAALLLVATGCAADSQTATSGESTQTSVQPGSSEQITSTAPTAAPPTTSSAPPVVTPDPTQDPVLIAAARAGDLTGVQQALAAGASVTATDQEGQTALIAAAYGNHLSVAETLIAAGADVNTPDKSVQSAYLIATSEVGDDPRLLQLMLAHGADVAALDSFNGTGLIRAADRGFPAIIATLLATPIDVNHVNRLGWTALHEAIILGDGSAGYIETVRALIAAGADVNLRSQRDGITPLQHAEARGYSTIANMLQEAGATRT